MNTRYVLCISDQSKYGDRWERYDKGCKLEKALLNYDGGSYGRDSLEYENEQRQKEQKDLKKNHHAEDLLWMAMDDPDIGWCLKGDLIDKIQPKDQLYACMFDATKEVGKAIINHLRLWGSALTYMGKMYEMREGNIVCTLYFVCDDDGKLTHRHN